MPATTTAPASQPQAEPDIDERIRRQIRINLVFFASNPDRIDARLEDLDREWDIERAVGALSSSVSLLGLAAAITRSRAWLLLPLTAQGFSLQQAVQGWCPPVDLLRRLGFRTRAEIDDERVALRVLRGDFRDAGLDDESLAASSRGSPPRSSRQIQARSADRKSAEHPKPSQHPGEEGSPSAHPRG